jgi:hypothetical protein
MKLSGKESSLFDTETNHYHNASCYELFLMIKRMNLEGSSIVFGLILDPLTVRIKCKKRKKD